MKKVTKKEIKEFIREVKRTKKIWEWRVYKMGVYIKYDKINFFVGYHGQALDENVIYGYYDTYYEFNLDDDIDIIYDNINDMINDYNEKTVFISNNSVRKESEED